MSNAIISCFPDPYFDEAFYSICARFQKRMQYPSEKSVVQKLFGADHITASIDFPSHLGYLSARLPYRYKYAISDFIKNHTLLPFYGPFLSSQRVDQLYQDMEGDQGLLAHLRVGAASSSIHAPEWLRYCPICLTADIGKFGEGYWHRLHQITGVEICPIHKVFLENSNARARGRKLRYEFLSIEQSANLNVIPRTFNSSNPIHHNLLKISHDAAWLLTHSSLPSEPEIIRDRYLLLLINRGLATYTGQVRTKPLLNEFKEFYSPVLFELLGCEINENDHNNWLFRLVRSPKQAKHPLYHLLLIQFLGYTVEEFFQLPSKIEPFGTGPWPCLNPVCQHFQQPSIDKYILKRDKTHGGRITATFQCVCGFTYSRMGPDGAPEDQHKVGKINARGHVWESRLKELWEDSTITLREMATRLGADSQSVKSEAARLGLIYPRSGPTSKQLQKTAKVESNLGKSEASKLEEYREEWLLIIQANPDIGRAALAAEHRRVYSWLQFYDQEWLKANLPPVKSRAPIFFQVDWHQRDIEIAAAIKIATDQLKDQPGKLEKLTKTAIACKAGYLTLIQKELDRLPLTAEVLAQSVETTEEFAVRRVHWVTECFHQKGIHPKHWQIVKQAGLKPYVAEMPKVKEAIASIVDLAKV